jgi:glycosyltransferase involved in cell wall biosynthesis
MPPISVVLPTFNRAHLIGQTIDSVLNQEFQDWNLVIVDDASQDNTIEVVSEYCGRDPRLRLVVNEKNLGLTRNWNRCLDLATGPLVEILQSDDLIDPDYLQIASQVFVENPQIGFVAASCRYIDRDGRLIHPGYPRPAQLYQAGDEAVTALLTGGWPHVTSIVIRRECYEKLGTFNEQIWHGPDGEMFTRIASRYDFYHFGGIHTSFRRHGSNMGVFEYLRPDFLTVDMYKKRLTWSYLSPEGLRRLGVEDLDQFITQDGVRAALTGATVTIAYDRADLSRFYLRQALQLDRRAWRHRQFWKALALLSIPSLGTRVMQARMGISDTDRMTVRAVEASLKAIGHGDA